MQEEMADADMPGEEELQAVADEEGLPVEQCVFCLPLILSHGAPFQSCHPIVSALLLERRQGVPGCMQSDVSAARRPQTTPPECICRLRAVLETPQAAAEQLKALQQEWATGSSKHSGEHQHCTLIRQSSGTCTGEQTSHCLDL